MLGEGPTNDITGSVDAAEQKFNWACIIMVIIVFNGKNISLKSLVTIRM